MATLGRIELTSDYLKELNDLSKLLSSTGELEQRVEEDLQKRRVANLEELVRLKANSIKTDEKRQIESLNKIYAKQVELQKAIANLREASEETATTDYGLEARLKVINDAANEEKKLASKIAEARYNAFEKKHKAYAQKRAELENEYNEKLAKDRAIVEAAAANKNASEEEKREARLAKRRIAYHEREQKKKLDDLRKTYKIKENEEEKAQEKANRRGQLALAQEHGHEMADGAFNNLGSFVKAIDNIKTSLQTPIQVNEDGKLELSNAVAAIADIAKQLENSIDAIAGKKSAVDTRLQGWGGKTGGGLFGIGGSYWDRFTSDLTKYAGVSPLIKQETFASKIESLVSQGIAFNVEQRAFLATISDKIAATFEATNGTLLRLIRVQQEDTTAARLGMESALTSFLNNMYETTEYMGSIANGIKVNLEESMALMAAKDAVGYEYQVQKWVGSLYSVGMSQQGVSSIAGSLGKLAAGDITGITGGGASNLMVMAANYANLPLADILAKGLDESSANQLLRAMVNYLAKIYAESSNSRVVQQQIASVYGLTASDLKAAAQLVSSVDTVANNFVNYNTSLQQLQNMTASMYSRTSMGEMLNNVWSNFTYTLSAGIAANPVLYATYKAAGLLEAVAGGMDLPHIAILGNTVNLQTSIADLMRVAALSGSIISGIGQLVSGISNAGGFNPVGTLSALGVFGKNKVTRGTSEGLLTASGATVSSSGYVGVGNASGDDVYNKTLTDATDDANAQKATAQEGEENNVTNVVINNSIREITELLREIVDGSRTLNVTTRADAGIGPWTSLQTTY